MKKGEGSPPGRVLSFLVIFICSVAAGTAARAAGPEPDLAGLQTAYPQQVELKAYEAFLKKKLVFKGNPLFTSKVAAGALPPVAKRLPAEPLVVIPEERPGRYGGTLDGLALSFESGTSEILSWRQANFVRYSKNNRTIVPNVAKSWEWNPDRTEITFTLRKGHCWSDGAPFTADDVVFYLNDIIMNRALHKQAPAPWREFEPKAVKIDDTRVKFLFKKPYTSLLFFLGGNGSYYDPFAPRHFLGRYHIKYNPNADKEARTEGFENWAARFKIFWNRWKDAVVSRATGMDVPTLESHILMAPPGPEGRIFIANPYYFKVDIAGNQLPYIDRHRERFMDKKLWPAEIIAGRVDQKSQNMPLDSYPELIANQAKGGYHIQLPITGMGPVIYFNKTHKDPVKRKVFADPRFNWAASLAINREFLNEALFLGLCRPQQALPQHIPFATEKDKMFMARYDPDQANAFLDEMGMKHGDDGFRNAPDGSAFTVFWDYSLQFVWSRDLPRRIAGFWNDLGLRVKLAEVSSKQAREKQFANENDISNELFSPFEPTLFASPTTFMPPYGTANPVMGIAWWEWKQSGGARGEEPPLWVKTLWEIGEEFTTLIPGTDWYDALGREIIRINQENLSVIGTLAEVPLVTVVSDKLGNVPQWNINAYAYGYAYPYRADQWYFKIGGI